MKAFSNMATSVESTPEPEGRIETLDKIRRESLETKFGYADMDPAYFARHHLRAASWDPSADRGEPGPAPGMAPAGKLKVIQCEQ